MTFADLRSQPPLGPFEQQQLKKLLSNWKLTPATFAYKISRGAWIPSPHLQYISLKLAKALAKGNARIILSMPPRHGKSELVSVYTPAWILEYLGKVSIILASYGADLAEGFHNRVRQMIEDPVNDSLLRVKPGNPWRAGELATSLGGYFYAVGLGGAITGRGADVLLIDDYIKEVKEALSPAYRDYIWNWYVTTAHTRLEPNGSIIIIATRWHSDDLIGRLRQLEPDEWEYIELPSLSLGKELDILHRPKDEPLFNERYTKEALLKIKRTSGTVWFEALYQQRPVDETMRITDVSWLQVWAKIKPLPKITRAVRIWDLAATEGAGDWLTGCLAVYIEDTEDFIILDYIHVQVGPGEVENIVKRVAVEDGANVEIGIEQEPGAAGKILVEHYKTNVLKDFKVKSIATGGKNKLVRAQPFLAAAEDGHVFYFQNEEWNRTFRAEFEVFPSTNKALHDDMVDTAAEAYTELTGKRPLSVSWGRPENANNGTGVKLRDTNTVPRRRTWNSNQIAKATGRKAAEGARVPTKIKGATWGRRSPFSNL